MTATEIHRTIEAVWKIESARLIAGLTRIVRDVGVAEELAQDALVVALEKWPDTGIPANPGAWLMGTAKHRAIDYLRHGSLVDRKHEDLGREMAEKQGSHCKAPLVRVRLGGIFPQLWPSRKGSRRIGAAVLQERG